MNVTESPSASDLQIFLPLLKADQAKRTLTARAAAEEPDKAGEIMDYETAVPQFKAWSQRYSDVTLGKSFGNVRAMHNPRHLAGKVEQIDFDDEGKAIEVVIKVLDPVDWDKVEKGGYTGLSIGGGYAKKWPDPLHKGLTRYTPRIAEISLVDSPCIPSATILELHKRDGTVDEVTMHGAPPRSFNELKPPMTFGERMAMEKSLAGAAVGGLAGSYVGRRVGAAVGVRMARDPSSVMRAATLGHHVGRTVGVVTGAGVGHLLTRRRDAQVQGIRPLETGAELGKAAMSPEARAKIKQTMHEFKHGKLRSFRADRAKKDMPHVTNRRQAIAIALSQARREMDGKSEQTGDLTKQDHAGTKARWIREGHPNIDADHDVVLQQAGRALLGKAAKVAAAHDARAKTWDAIADTQAAYDRVRKSAVIPKDHHLMMLVPHHGGLLYNPEGVGDAHFDERGKPKVPMYLMHHDEADDFIAKHGKLGKGEPMHLVSHQDDILLAGLAAAA